MQLTPCGVAQKDLLWAIKVVVPAEEQCCKVICSCTGNRLHACNTSLGNGRRVCAEDQFRGSRGKLGQTGDRQVLVVIVGVTQ